MSSRRAFIQKMGLLSSATIAVNLLQTAWGKNLELALKKVESTSPVDLATNEDFWHYVQQSYTIAPNFINLNNGGVAPAPKSVADNMKTNYDICNQAPSYFMWRIIDVGREQLRKNLAQLAGCSAEEIALHRNTSEALETVIFGIELKAGDEVVLAKQDYPNMLNAWKQREKREGIKLVWVNHEFPSEDAEALTKKYTSLFTDKTRVVHVTHMINWVGQVLPVRKIADEAHKKNIEVICDSAHTFGLLDYKIGDLGCDYWATSLHKWLGAPFGSGMMWIKKEKIKDVWALMSNNEPDGTDIRKFESLGTRSFPSEMAISAAIDFHSLIGSKRKESRMHFLREYWTSRVQKFAGVKIITPNDRQFCGAIASVFIEGLKPEDIEAKLMEKYRIHCVAINWENIHGARITPNVYTSIADLDLLVQGIKEIAEEKGMQK